jgi:hypothetical protein
MKTIALMLVITLCAGIAATQQPGPAPTLSESLALKLSVSQLGSEAYFIIELQNLSDSPIAVPLGYQTWYQGRGVATPDNLHLIAVTAKGVHMHVFPLGGPPGIGGNLQPLVVTLTPKGSYIIRRPISSYRMYTGNSPLEPLRDVTVDAEVRAEKRSCSPSLTPGCEPDQLVICWNGVVTSNSVQVP